MKNKLQHLSPWAIVFWNTKNALLVLFALMTIGANAQQVSSIRLDGNTNGTTITVGCAGVILYDDGGAGDDYARGHDCRATLEGVCSEARTGSVLMLKIDEYDIAPSDTLYIYDGENSSAPLLIKLNNNYSSTTERYFAAGPSNSSNKLFVRFRAVAGQAPTGAGFKLTTEVKYPCDDIVAAIDSVFYEVYVDTISHRLQMIDNGRQNKAAISCFGRYGGQTMIMTANCTRSNRFGYPANEGLLWYRWSVVDADSTNYWNRIYCDGNRCTFHNTSMRSKQLRLYVTDSYGCASNTDTIVLVNPLNPVKSIWWPDPLHGYDSTMLVAGYEPRMELNLKNPFKQEMKKVYDYHDGVFICDSVENGWSGVVELEVDEFEATDTIVDVAQVAQVCVGIEHSNMDDVSIAIACPSYRPEQDSVHGIAYLLRSHSGNNHYLGVPLGGDNHAEYDYGCDDSRNEMGCPYSYCFSRNGDYYLCDGTPAHAATSGDSVSYLNHGSLEIRRGVTTTQCSNFNGTDCYLPESDYSSLVGCPLNGTWKLLILDEGPDADNGWVTDLSLDLMVPRRMNNLDAYLAIIDSVRWQPDTNYDTDFPGGGLYHGLDIEAVDDFNAMLHATNLSHQYRINISAFDEFGCQFDTSTFIQTIADTTLSVDELVSNVDPINLYPNPARGSVVVEVVNFSSPTMVRVLDAMGRTLMQQPADQPRTQICLPSDRFAKGIYFIQVGNETPRKLIIQ